MSEKEELMEIIYSLTTRDIPIELLTNAILAKFERKKELMGQVCSSGDKGYDEKEQPTEKIEKLSSGNGVISLGSYDIRSKINEIIDHINNMGISFEPEKQENGAAQLTKEGWDNAWKLHNESTPKPEQKERKKLEDILKKRCVWTFEDANSNSTPDWETVAEAAKEWFKENGEELLKDYKSRRYANGHMVVAFWDDLISRVKNG